MTTKSPCLASNATGRQEWKRRRYPVAPCWGAWLLADNGRANLRGGRTSSWNIVSRSHNAFILYMLNIMRTVFWILPKSCNYWKTFIMITKIRRNKSKTKKKPKKQQTNKRKRGCIVKRIYYFKRAETENKD